MNILLILNLNKIGSIFYIQKIIDTLSAINAHCYLPNDDHTYFHIDGLSIWPYLSYKQIDLILVVGGDGTILNAAQTAICWDKPLLGINFGKVGFMAGLEPKELPLLSLLKSKNYEESKRMFLELSYRNEENGMHTFIAVNDILISKTSHKGMLEIEVEYHHKPFISYRTDALLFSTPNGSTAYSFSNGGPIADPHLEFIAMSPICSFNQSGRTYLFHKDRTVTANLKNTGSFSQEGEILIDGNYIGKVKNASLMIKGGKKQLRLIILNDKSKRYMVNDRMIKKIHRQ